MPAASPHRRVDQLSGQMTADIVALVGQADHAPLVHPPDDPLAGRPLGASSSRESFMAHLP
jgi:hypothetical protein